MRRDLYNWPPAPVTSVHVTPPPVTVWLLSAPDSEVMAVETLTTPREPAAQLSEPVENPLTTETLFARLVSPTAPCAVKLRRIKSQTRYLI
jgi:hypothetical protein